MGLPVLRWAGRSFRVRPNIPTRSEHRQQLVGECSECGTHSADHPPTGKKIRQVQICEPRLGRRIRSVPDLSPNPRVQSQSPLPFVPIKLPLSFGNQQYSCDQLSRDASVVAPRVYVNGSASRIFSHGRCCLLKEVFHTTSGFTNQSHGKGVRETPFFWSLSVTFSSHSNSRERVVLLSILGGRKLGIGEICWEI